MTGTYAPKPRPISGLDWLGQRLEIVQDVVVYVTQSSSISPPRNGTYDTKEEDDAKEAAFPSPQSYTRFI
jgi:hypothetical protein